MLNAVCHITVRTHLVFLSTVCSEEYWTQDGWSNSKVDRIKYPGAPWCVLSQHFITASKSGEHGIDEACSAHNDDDKY